MIGILLSTYNGEQFLSEQIESIINQSYTDWKLIIRDDGSTDSTVEIIDSYYALLPKKICKINSDKDNIGAIRSFELLLSECKSEYIMFCDQDDVWLPNKIEISLNELTALEKKFPNKPIIVHTNMYVANSDLKVVAPDFWQYANLKPEILDKDFYLLSICNSVTGCTMIFNQLAKNSSLPFPTNAIMHDAWMAVKTSQLGIIVGLNTPTIYYRQHGANCLGAVKYNFKIANKLKQLPTLFKRDWNIYSTYHPLVFKNFVHFLYHKLRLFYRIHIKQK